MVNLHQIDVGELDSLIRVALGHYHTDRHQQMDGGQGLWPKIGRQLLGQRGWAIESITRTIRIIGTGTTTSTCLMATDSAFSF